MFRLVRVGAVARRLDARLDHDGRRAKHHGAWSLVDADDAGRRARHIEATFRPTPSHRSQKVNRVGFRRGDTIAHLVILPVARSALRRLRSALIHSRPARNAYRIVRNDNDAARCERVHTKRRVHVRVVFLLVRFFFNSYKPRTDHFPRATGAVARSRASTPKTRTHP